MRRAIVQFQAERDELLSQLEQANRRCAELQAQQHAQQPPTRPAAPAAAVASPGPPRDPETGVRQARGNPSWGVAPTVDLSAGARPQARDDFVPREFFQHGAY